MTSADFLFFCTLAAIAILTLAFLVISVRIIIGPTLPDRVLGLDMLVVAGIGFIAAIAIKTGYVLFLDIAISLALVGFLATVAFARFILKRDRPNDAEEVPTPVADQRGPETVSPSLETKVPPSPVGEGAR